MVTYTDTFSAAQIDLIHNDTERPLLMALLRTPKKRSWLRSGSGTLNNPWNDAHHKNLQTASFLGLLYVIAVMVLENCDAFFTFYCGIEQLPPTNSVSN